MSVHELLVAVRAWAVPDYLREEKGGRGRAQPTRIDLGPSEWSLTFDTETLAAELGQGLRIVVGQVRHRENLVETVIGYDPEVLSAAEMGAVHAYASDRGIRVLARGEFVDDVFYDVAWGKRGLVVGSVNLVFDLTRLAISHHISRPRRKDRTMRGGFTLKLSENPSLPEIQVRRINSRAAFVRFVTPPGRHPEARNRERGGAMANHRGYFVDVGVLGSALLGGKFSLRRLAETLGTSSQKLDIDTHDRAIDAEYLDYAVADVQTTWECFSSLRDRYSALGLNETPIHRLYSEASVAKAYLKEMGVRPWREVQPEVPDWLIATIMETYYGGRTEAGIRHVPVPGVYLDVRSEYPTVYVLQGLWPYQIAEGIEWEREDPKAFKDLVEWLSPEDVLDPGFWPWLTTLVLVSPQGDRLPTRASFGGGSAYNVAVARRVGGPAQWVTAADYVASKLHTDHAPEALEVVRFRPLAPQEGLRSVEVASQAAYRIDPYRDDLIKRMVELRAEVRQDLAQARQDNDQSLAALLDSAQQGMKVTANSVSYGAPIEMNVVEHPKPVGVTVTRPDRSTYRTQSTRTEEPGSYFHPLIATLVSGGGRLMLALAMRLVADQGTYAFCDTDSLFVVATEQGGSLTCP